MEVESYTNGGITRKSPLFLSGKQSLLEPMIGAAFWLRRGGKNSLGRMSEVKFDFSTVRTRVIPILKRVEDSPAKIAASMVGVVSMFCYCLKKLKCGLVKFKFAVGQCF
jgi:hypothetical protein